MQCKLQIWLSAAILMAVAIDNYHCTVLHNGSKPEVIVLVG